MKEDCTYYQFKKSIDRSRTIIGDRNPKRPMVSKKAVCAHEEMAHRLNTIGPSPCGGDISKCEIPHIWK